MGAALTDSLQLAAADRDDADSILLQHRCGSQVHILNYMFMLKGPGVYQNLLPDQKMVKVAGPSVTCYTLWLAWTMLARHYLCSAFCKVLDCSICLLHSQETSYMRNTWGQKEVPGGKGELISCALDINAHVPQIVQEPISINFSSRETLERFRNFPVVLVLLRRSATWKYSGQLG